MQIITSLGRKFFNQQDIRKLQIYLKEINTIVNRLSKTIDTELKEHQLDQKQKKQKNKYCSNSYYSKREGMGC